MHYLPEPRPDTENFPRSEDCPECGRPTLVATFYGGMFDEEVRLDAMPVRTFSRVTAAPYGGCVTLDAGADRNGTDRYIEHACPVRV